MIERARDVALALPSCPVLCVSGAPLVLPNGAAEKAVLPLRPLPALPRNRCDAPVGLERMGTPVPSGAAV